MNHVFFHLELQSGPYCQSPDGNPMARMSIIGYSARSACRCSSISLLGDIMLINHLIMHISKYIRFGDTLERCCKGKAFIWIVQGFWKKSVEMEVIFNSCWVLEIQNEVSANQRGSSTNHIGRFGGLDVISGIIGDRFIDPKE